MNTRTKKFVIIGAGASAAACIKKLIEAGHSRDEIIVIEKSSEIGGKCKTYSLPENPKIKTEYGAGVLTHNYPIIDDIVNNGLHVEKLIPTERSTVSILEKIDQLSSRHKKVEFGFEFALEMIKFAGAVWSYNGYCKDLDKDLPKDFFLPFAEFADQYELGNIATFLEFLGPGFGYGDMTDENTYTYRMLNYMGYTTIPSLAAADYVFGESLVCVHEGYQAAIESMFDGIEVVTSAEITAIKRNEDNVKVHYTHEGQEITIDADNLILTMSPDNWPELNMELTEREQACVDEVKVGRYPVAICRVEGLPANQLFMRDAFEKEGFGHVAFLFTRDNRPEPDGGRLCTAYINIANDDTTFSLAHGSEGRHTLEKDLLAIPGVTKVHIEDVHEWKYNPIVPWSTGIALQKEEKKGKSKQTLHLGTYLPGSFETVAGAQQYARDATHEWLHLPQESATVKFFKDVKRAWQFFRAERQAPMGSDATLRENDSFEKGKEKERPSVYPA